MSNALKLTITAADKATKAINNINARVNRMTRPLQDMERSLQRFGRAAGFGVVKEKLQGLTQSAGRVAKSFAKIGAPLLALVGGGTIAGLLALTEGWTKFGLSLSQTAQILGVNTQALYDFQNAARLVGISGQAATQAFQGFADTLQDARWGRNQQAMGVLLGLGIRLKSTKSGSIDAMDALGQVADKIHQFQQTGHSGAARTLARQLGLSSLLPVLMRGRKALEDYEAQSEKLAGTMDWKQAAAAAMQWNRLGVAMEGVKNTVGAALLPVITPLITQFGTWIQANRQLIATDIGDFIKGLGNAFKGLSLKTVLDDILAIVKGMLNLVTGTAQLVQRLGGLKPVLEGLAVLWGTSKIVKFGAAIVTMGLRIGVATKALVAWRAARALATAGSAASGAGLLSTAVTAGGVAGAAIPGVPLGIGLGYAIDKIFPNNPLAKLGRWAGGAIYDRTHRAQTAMDFFQSRGWTRAQAAGISANIQAESGFSPGAMGDRGKARGIGQWHPDRQANFNAWAARNKFSNLEHAGLLEQLQFYDYELRHSDAGARLKGAKSAYEAAGIVSRYDERPADAAGQAAARGQLAERLAGPTVNVDVKTTVHRDGSAVTRVATPSGVKIVNTSPVAALG